MQTMASRGAVTAVIDTARHSVVELADSHCHLDMFKDGVAIDTAVRGGVSTMITNAVSLDTCKRALEISDSKHVFPALGIDPQSAMAIGSSDIETIVGEFRRVVEASRHKVVAIGEIGLDFYRAKDGQDAAIQTEVFTGMLDIAMDMGLPVSVHSRSAMDKVLGILSDRDLGMVHLHFFEGNVQQAKEAERHGYMISIPPVESGRRKAVIRDVSLDNLMAESDCPAVGSTPLDVEMSVRMVAEAKGIGFERAAETLTQNTKAFFKLAGMGGLRRS